MLRDYRSVNPWRGITAVVLVTAGALVAAAYAVMAMLVLRREQ